MSLIQPALRLFRRWTGLNAVLMSDGHMTRWREFAKHNCDAKFGDVRPQKAAKVGPIGRETRAAVELRSGGMCELRGARCTRTAVDIHHRIYRRNGGTNELENLAHTCLACHQSIHAADNPKSSRESISDFLARKIRWT